MSICLEVKSEFDGLMDHISILVQFLSCLNLLNKKASELVSQWTDGQPEQGADWLEAAGAAGMESSPR